MLTQALSKNLDFDSIFLVNTFQKRTFCCHLFDANCYQVSLHWRGSCCVSMQRVHTQVCKVWQNIITVKCAITPFSQPQLNLTHIVIPLITHINISFYQKRISYILLSVLQKGDTNMFSSHFIGFWGHVIWEGCSMCKNQASEQIQRNDIGVYSIVLLIDLIKIGEIKCW